jgi:hypothetical protein
MAEDNKITQTSEYILPVSILAAAINQAADKGNKSVVVRMPDQIIDKPEYVLNFAADNLDDAFMRNLDMVYIETPYGFVGLNLGVILQSIEENSNIRILASPYQNGIKVAMTANGKTVSSCGGFGFQYILPFEGQSAAGYTPVSGDVFGDAYNNTAELPLTVSKYDRSFKAMIFSAPNTGAFLIRENIAVNFSDIPAGHWAKEHVDRLSAVGVISGVGNNRYDGTSNVTREQFCKIVTGVFSAYQAPQPTGFNDVAAGSFFYPYISSAKDIGIINGLSATQFGMGRNVTREDAVVMLYRAATLFGIELPQVREKVTFSDDAAIAEYAREAVYKMYEAGIIDGETGGRFAPKGATTRAAVAKIANGVYELVINNLAFKQ